THLPLLVLPLDFDHVSPHLDLQLLRREMLHVQADGKLVVVQVHLMAKQFGLGKKALYLSGSLEIPDTKHFHAPGFTRRLRTQPGSFVLALGTMDGMLPQLHH
ncbi:hypothetical protein E2320_007202, partial [Naja naja]